MEHELWIYMVLVIFAGLLSCGLSVYALIKLRGAPGGTYYSLSSFFAGIFAFSYAFELGSSTFEQMKFWLMIEYFVLPFIPVFILHMCSEYVGIHIKRRIQIILFLIPFLTIFMHNTNDLHHLYYTSLGLREDSSYPVLHLVGGPWFYVHSIFLYLCFASAVTVLLLHMRKVSFRFRMQIILMVMGLVIPILGGALYINGLSQYGVDFGPVSLSIAFIFQGAALLSFQMFNVQPIARDSVFESLREGVIVLNEKGIIVDFNQAVTNILSIKKRLEVGKSVESTLKDNPTLAGIIALEEDCDYEANINGELQYYHLRFTPVKNKNRIQQRIGLIVTFANITERVHLQDKLTYFATIDGLTKVFNRSYFMKKSEKVFSELRVRGKSSCASVILFDIDHFKNVNDTYGHEIGDTVLTSFVERVKGCIRPTDIFGRYGGEEFVLFLPNTTLSEAYGIAHDIRGKVASSPIVSHQEGSAIGDLDTVMIHGPTLLNTPEIVVTSSFGISSVTVDEGIDQRDARTTIQGLIREADQALYAAKRNGRNCVEVAGNFLSTVK